MRSENKRTRKQHRTKKRHQKSEVDETSAQTRKEQKRKRKAEKRMEKKQRRRIFPIWLRLIVIVIGCVGALLAGAMIGYGVIGDGAPLDALKKETWQHILDIVKKNE